MGIILLVASPQDDPWQKSMQELLDSLGDVRIVQAQSALNGVADPECILVLVDATHTDAVPQLVAALRARRPDARIVVATASPTWEQARSAYEAGAIDYIPKSLSRAEMLESIQSALNRPLLQWPQRPQ